MTADVRRYYFMKEAERLREIVASWGNEADIDFGLLETIKYLENADDTDADQESDTPATESSH